MMESKFLDPKNDVCFKRIFGTEKNKHILIHFINDIMGFEGGEVIEDVTFLSPVQDPDIACKKQSIVDVLCKAVDGTQIIIEMQVARTTGFEKRAQYYAAKAYTSQLNKGQEEDGVYQNLKSVIFIAITDYVMFPEKEDYLSRHVILDKKTKENDLDAFSFTFIELPKFKKQAIGELNNIIEKWCYFFKNARKTDEKDVVKIVGQDEVIEKAYEELNYFGWTEQQRLSYEREVKRVADNNSVELQKKIEFEERMKKMEERVKESEERVKESEERVKESEELAKKREEQGIQKGLEEGIQKGLEEGIQKGLEEGIQKGLEEGIQKGLEEGIKKIAISMLQKGLSSEQVSEFTGLTIEQIELLKKDC